MYMYMYMYMYTHTHIHTYIPVQKRFDGCLRPSSPPLLLPNRLLRETCSCRLTVARPPDCAPAGDGDGV